MITQLLFFVFILACLQSLIFYLLEDIKGTAIAKLSSSRQLQLQYQPSGTYNAAPPGKSKIATRGPKMADGVWKDVYT